MIPANELRIGNWVLCDELQVELHPRECQITSLATKVAHWKSGPIDGLGVGSCHSGTPYENLTPIPLTPEVMEKCWFDWIIWDGNEHHKVLSYKNTPIHTYWDGSDWCFKYGFDSDLTFAACQYVHQLQNLIHVLTGEELTVNL